MGLVVVTGVGGSRILVVNAGSSSLKLGIVGAGDEVESVPDTGPAGADTVERLHEVLRGAGPIAAVGHRIVHGGADFSLPVVIDADVRARLDAVSDLAPLHNPPALAGVDAARRLLPDVPSVACFDTAFHATIPPEAATYAVPEEWRQLGLRRYGFHGLSCAWATRRAAELLGRPVPALRLLICHLGAGASVTAVAGGRSIDTTMGFSPLEGLVMATRSGDVDPGGLLWMLEHGSTLDEVSDALERRSGTLGLGGSGDMRELLARREAGDEQARLAIGVYLHRLRAKIAAMAAPMGGSDALVFTGGVGEHADAIRAETVAGLEWMGYRLDPGANVAASGTDVILSAPDATPAVLVIRAREDLEIARQCRSVLAR